MDNIFEQASRQKLRFVTNRGNVATEDLWDLTLEQLDEVAIALNKKVKETSNESFIKKTSKTDKKAVLMLEVVKSVITTKMEEEVLRKNAADRRAKRQRIMQLITEKEDATLGKKSIAKLREELEELEEIEES
jgi:hypothetical protein